MNPDPSYQSSFEAGLEAAVGPVMAQAGFELVMVECAPAARILRLYIDRLQASNAGDGAHTADAAADTVRSHAAGLDASSEAAVADAEGAAQGGVTIDDCARMSRLVSDWLDAGGGAGTAGALAWLSGHYNLEVSSPGLDRPLCRPAHFCRFVGAQVSVQADAGQGPDGRRRIKGTLAQAAAEPEGDITLETPEGTYRIAYPSITRARLVPDLGQRATKEPRHGR